MANANDVNKQLKRLGVNFQFWCRPEVRELPKILFDDETLEHVLVGRYEGGFALFCATDHRVLLIDKKPFYLTIEDIRYDMISDVQFNHRLIDATVRLGTMHKTLSFTAYNHKKLRDFTSYIQEQVMAFRQLQNTSPEVRPELAGHGVLNPISSVLAASRPHKNPYSAPVIIRRRVSRFY